VWLEAMPAATYIDRVETSTTFDAQFRDADLNLRVLVSGGRGFGGGGRGGAPAGGGRGANAHRTQATICGHPDRARWQRTTLSCHSGPSRHGARHAAHHARERAPALDRRNAQPVPAHGGTGAGRRVTHARTSAVGFRQISTAGGVLRINGQAVKLRGVCRHDENPDVGRATRREDWLQDLRLMKAANINMVRTSHYPPAEGFIELCDEMGMYVLDEVPMGFGGGSATTRRSWNPACCARRRPSRATAIIPP
jgi:beta-galactosidase